MKGKKEMKKKEENDLELDIFGNVNRDRIANGD